MTNDSVYFSFVVQLFSNFACVVSFRRGFGFVSLNLGCPVVSVS